MRFSIRSQILLPIAVTMSLVVLGSAAINATLAKQSATRRIQQRIHEVTAIFENASFPLTDQVLVQMSGLAGADFVLAQPDGTVTAASHPTFSEIRMPSGVTRNGGLGDTLTVAGNQYFHRVLPLNNDRHQSNLRLHAFFSAGEYRRIWQRAWLPSLGAVGTALVAAIACASWVGGSISRSTRTIISQLQDISAGQFQQRQLPLRNDELQDLASALNRTAGLLQNYEREVRRGERMKTMVMVGAGLAHQIRNSVTGCLMALDIFQDELRRSQTENEVAEDEVAEDGAAKDEAMQVACRQLALIENYLERFLMLAKIKPKESSRSRARLSQIVKQALSLVQYSAMHLHVDLRSEIDSDAEVEADVIAIEQAVVNLLLNAIEAASTAAAKRTGAINSPTARVGISIQYYDEFESAICVVVRDNGDGPSSDDDVFAPFVTGKPSGVGLGLAVVKEVADDHQGRASWRRHDAWTEFTLELPLAPQSIGAATADHESSDFDGATS